jgi:TonB-linked SusC/RagA family outer membrane protein
MRKKQQVASLSLAMKIFVQLTLGMVFTCSLYATPSTAQEILDRSVSISASNIEVTKVIAKVQKQSGVKFIFSPNSIEAGRKISCNIKDKPLSQFLNQVLRPLGIGYNIVEEQVVLYALKTSSVQLEDNKDVYDRTITGIITNEAGQPLVGASINVKNTTRYTTSNAKGEFTIEVADNNAILVISYTGYEAKEISVGGNNSINVALVTTNKAMDEVVVVGYGTQKRTNVTGAISTVNGKTLSELPVPSISQALQGRVAGVNVTNNGSPGTQPIVRIRGISSISFASDPLYVIDGFPTGDLSTIDTRDIESVDVLKDASASAIYGSRATSGVIMITTKKGRRDSKIHVSLDSYYGTQEITERLDLLDAEGFKKYALAYRGSLPGRLLPPEVDKPIYTGATQTYGQTNTDWQDAYFKKGNMTQHNVGLSGGNEVSRFYASAGYMEQEGTAPKVGYRRYNFRLNSDHVVSKVFTFGENLYGAFGDQDYDANENGARTNLVNVIRMMPHIPVYDPTSVGGFRGVNSVLDGGDPTNPVEDASLKNPANRSTAKILGIGFLEVNFTKWLKFRSTLGVDYVNGLNYRFQPIYNDNGTIAGSSATQATITNNRTISTTLLYTEQLSFDKTFGDHHINAIAVYEQQSQKMSLENGSGNQLSNDLRTLNNASNISFQTQKGENTLMSVLGRVNYDFKGKYLLSGAVRRDGLSIWAPGAKWATFPSGSIGWRIDQEDFMRNQAKISELKLRVGYGVTGLNGVAAFGFPWTPWLVSVNANSAYYPFGNTISSGPASSIQRLGNKELNWEKTRQLNIGLDLGLLSNKVTLSAEYFRRKTVNLILAVPTSPSMGYIITDVSTNVGEMINNGFELQLGYNDRVGDFKWNASANMSANTNEVTKLAEGVTNIERGADNDFGAYNITNTAPGHPVQSFYGWEVEGIFQDAAEVAAHAKQTAGTAPGDIKFKDLNKDNVIDLKDRQFLGSFIPKVTYALNLGANYKNFDASVFFQGVQGNKIYNAARVITEGMVRFFNAGTQVLNAWTPTNKNTNIPRAISSDPNQNARPSTRFLEDGSYLRLKNIMLGYNIPAASLQSLTKGVVSNFRIYVSAQNILTFTDYSGYDPEVGNRTPNSTLTNGIDFAVYPQPKSYLVGIQVNF